jgi:outer membrane protein TolC
MNAQALSGADFVLTDTAAALGDADAVEDHLKAARELRPDYRRADMLAQKYELDLVQTKNGLMPKLDAFFTVEGQSPAESFARALVPNGDISPVISWGLTFSMPVRNGAARERHRRTQFTAEQQKLAVADYDRLIEYEVRTAHMDVLRAERQVETARTVSALRLKTLEAEQEKMNAGKSTGYDVLQVQRDLVSANLDEAQARTTRINALITLFSRDGTLLKRRGVDTDFK